MIFKKFRYFFYRVYTWQLDSYGQASSPSTAAQSAVLTLLWFNLFTVISIIEMFIGRYINPFVGLSRPLLCILLVGHYFVIDRYISRNNVCKKVTKEFKSETPKERLQGTIFIWSYTIGSIIAVIISVCISKHMHDAGVTVLGYLHYF